MSDIAPEGQPAPGPLSPDYVAPTAEPQVEYAQIPADEWQDTQETLGMLRDALDHANQPPPPQYQQGQPEPFVLDPLADDFQSQLDRYIDQRIQPIAQTTQRWQTDQGEELARDILSDIASREGDFDQGMARNIAERFLPETQAQYGQTRRAAEAALEKAAAEVRAYEDRIGKAALERHNNQLHTRLGAQSEPGAAGGAAQVHTPVQGGDEMAVVRAYGGVGR